MPPNTIISDSEVSQQNNVMLTAIQADMRNLTHVVTDHIKDQHDENKVLHSRIGDNYEKLSAMIQEITGNFTKSLNEVKEAFAKTGRMPPTMLISLVVVLIMAATILWTVHSSVVSELHNRADRDRSEAERGAAIVAQQAQQRYEDLKNLLREQREADAKLTRVKDDLYNTRCAEQFRFNAMIYESANPGKRFPNETYFLPQNN